MKLVKSINNIHLGKDFKLKFGENDLTLDQGFMSVGGKLPAAHDLVTPELDVLNYRKVLGRLFTPYHH